MIELQNFSKEYDSFKAVSNLSYTFEKGTITGILGPNGAGKTTILKALTGRHFASEGKVIFSETIDAAQAPEKIRNLTGFVEETASLPGGEIRPGTAGYRSGGGHEGRETASLPGEYTVKEYITFVAELHGCNQAAVENVIKKCSLEEYKNKKINSLSKGYKERVNFAQALVYNPEILILDEPASGLDPQQIVNMRALVKDLSKDHTIILSTHLMQEVEALCEKVLIINHGKLLAQGTKDEIVKNTVTKNLEEAFFKLTSSSGKEEEK